LPTVRQCAADASGFTLCFLVCGEEARVERMVGDDRRNESQMKTQQDYAAPARRHASGRTWHTPILFLWGVLIGCVVIGSLLPAASPVMVAIGRRHIWDKLQHFGAYLALSILPVIGFRDRHRGLAAGLSMFFLGVVLELGQHFSPGRAVELGDVIANGAGVSCGTLAGLPIRTLIAKIAIL